MAKQIKDNDTGRGAEDPDDVVKAVARKLQEIRIHTGLTQTQLGEKAGLKQSYIFELEYGTTNVTLRTLEKMAKALNIGLRDLLPGAPGAPPSESDIKHIMVSLDRLKTVVEEYLLNERQRIEREEERRAKQEVVLLDSLRSIAELRYNLRPLNDAEQGKVANTE